MSAIERLNVLVDTLNKKIDDETAQQKAIVEELRKLADGNDNEVQLNALADRFEQSVNRVSSIVPDAQTETGPPAPGVEPI